MSSHSDPGMDKRNIIKSNCNSPGSIRVLDGDFFVEDHAKTADS